MMEKLRFTLNGEELDIEVPANLTLRDLLHDKLGLTGAKEACGAGLCGSCTVIVDGLAVKSCLVLALQMEGKTVLSIEGLAREDILDPIQKAFVDNGAIQCGYCTSGMIMASKALLEETPNPTEREVRETLSGNLCRCTGYQKIVKAVLSVGDRNN